MIRGKVTVEILEAASGPDLIAVGRSGWSLARKMQLGSTAQTAAINAPKALLLVKQPLAVDRPGKVIPDGSPAAEQALKAAVRFAGGLQAGLTVFLAADSAVKAKVLEGEAPRLSRPKVVQARLADSLRH